MKGREINTRLSSYTVIDTETTGLDPRKDELLELAALRVRDNEVAASFSALVRPRRPIPPEITRINGITDGMVREARTLDEVLPDYLSFLGDDVLYGFNTVFDVSFLRTACALDNDFVDVRKIAQAVYPDFKPGYKLSLLAREFRLGSQEHRALSDCDITKKLYDALNAIADDRGLDYTAKRLPEGYIRLKDILRLDSSRTLFSGDCFVFTGTLSKLGRREAMQHVVNLGGTVSHTVNGRTKYLVVGTQEFIEGKSSKEKKAEQIGTKILDEEEFYSLIGIS